MCSPTRATILTGRTNNRDCIDSALPCCQENPAPTCSQGRGLPWSEFTVAEAAKKSKLGDYATIQLGKWHLGDLWNKQLIGGTPVSSPGDHGFDEWLTTQAEASNSMSNCGCFPVNHTIPGPKPPSGYPSITPHGDQCVVGGGKPSDWCYPCTNYYYPNASDPRNVTELQLKVPGDDSEFLVDHFEAFLKKQTAANRPWLAHICFHAIHEPHPSMPIFYDMYQNDPDYLGALTMWDVQVGRIRRLLEEAGQAENTAIFYTADNGPHQGQERTDIHWSTNFLRQCKASMWEGGIRVPGMVHFPRLISSNKNISTPTTTADFMPTVMSILEVVSENPSWAMDGIDLIPLVNASAASSSGASRAADPVGGYLSRPKPLGFDSTGGQHAVIDNNWKLLHNPGGGQCQFQPPYNSWKNLSKIYMLFDLDTDYHELHDLSSDPAHADTYTRLMTQMEDFLASVAMSQVIRVLWANLIIFIAPRASVASVAAASDMLVHVPLMT